MPSGNILSIETFQRFGQVDIRFKLTSSKYCPNPNTPLRDLINYGKWLWCERNASNEKGVTNVLGPLLPLYIIPA